MDLQYKAFTEAYCLIGIVTTLRKMYQPRFEPCEQITSALLMLARRERAAARAFEPRVLAHAD